MAYCKHCDKEVEPVWNEKLNRFSCPDCNRIVQTKDSEKEEPQVSEIPLSKKKEIKHYKKKEPDMIQEGKTKLVMTPKTIKYDAANLYIVKILIDLDKILIGLKSAKDLNDLFREKIEIRKHLTLIIQTHFQQELLKSLKQSNQNNKTETEENKEIIT